MCGFVPRCHARRECSLFPSPAHATVLPFSSLPCLPSCPHRLWPLREEHGVPAIALPALRWSLLPEPGFCPQHGALHRLHSPPLLSRRSAHYRAIAPPAEDTHTATLHSVFVSLSVLLQIAGTNALHVPREILSSCLCCTKEPGGFIRPSLASGGPPRSSSGVLFHAPPSSSQEQERS